MRFAPWCLVSAAALAGCSESNGSYDAAPPYAVAVDSRASVAVVMTCGQAMPLTGGGAGAVYRLPGVPDGMGLLRRDGRTVLFMNHEFPKYAGPAAGPLPGGARMSELTLDESGKVTSARPAISEVWLGEPATRAESGKVRLGKLCSAFMAGAREGFDPPMFLAGEETSGGETFDGRGGQAFGLANGALYALPRLGRAPWEDPVVLPGTGDITAVVCLPDVPAKGDGLHSMLYLYVGKKDRSGADPPAKNGLRGGKLFTFVSDDPANSSEATFKEKGREQMGHWVEVNPLLTDAELEAASAEAGAFRFVRIEDGAPDPSHPGTMYFTTTGRPGSANPMGRVSRLVVDPSNPAAWGKLSIVIDGSEGIVSPDNVDVNAHGELAICEDPVPSLESVGVARDTSLWILDLSSGKLTRVLEVARRAAGEHWRTVDRERSSIDKEDDHAGGWEISGVVDAEAYFGRGTWLLNVQAHALATSDDSLIQGGQILKLVWNP